MSLTPVEIRHVRLPRRPFGYGRENVRELLEEIVQSFEDVWRDRADLRDEVERLEGELARYKELDVLLRNSLVSAERAADELRAQAGKEADLIVVDPAMTAPLAGGDDDDADAGLLEDPSALVSRLIFRTHPDMVRGAWVRGRQLEGPS